MLERTFDAPVGVTVTNPATALAGLLEQWTVRPNKSPEEVRGKYSDPKGREFWRGQAKAVDLAFRVDNLLRGMEAAGQPTAMFSASIVSWYEAVFAFSVPWQTTDGAERQIIERARLENLQGLGVMLDQVGVVEIAGDETQRLRTVLDEAKQLVASDKSLSHETRRYIWSLIVEAQATLDEIDTFGDEPSRSILLELGGAMTVQAEIAEGEGDQATASRWRITRDSIIGGFMGGVGGQLAIKAADGLQKAIDTGLS
jgi:hypothetical protein